MSRNAIIAAAFVALAAAGGIAAIVNGKLNDLVITRIVLTRAAPNVCTGEVRYLFSPTDPVLADLPIERPLQLSVPCARLDAYDTLGSAPGTRGGKVTVSTRVAAIWRKEAGGLCASELTWTVTPTDAELAAALGSRDVTRFFDDVPCSRAAGSLVGAQVTGKAGWPVAIVPLPLPEAPPPP